MTELRINVVGDILKYGADNFKEDMLDSMRDETYSSFHHMYALASVVCYNIRSVYRESKNLLCQTK